MLGPRKQERTSQKYVYDYNLDICCLQETEIDIFLNAELLSFPGYAIEVENNDIKRRVAIYVSNRIKYRRRNDLEGSNNHFVIIDLVGGQELRLISICRSFKTHASMSAKDKFEEQLSSVKNVMTNNTIFLGDFNLDYSKKFDITYCNKYLLTVLTQLYPTLGFSNMLTLLRGPEWSTVPIRNPFLTTFTVTTPPFYQTLVPFALFLGTIC
jgi:exonuclease III